MYTTQAVSDWRVVSRFRSAGLGGTHLTLLHVYPRHGRKHQIRIHCANGLGHSILGDRHHRGTLVGEGLFLCAIGVNFTHPTSYEQLHITLPYPERFTAFPERENREFEKARQDPEAMARCKEAADAMHLRLSRKASAAGEEEEEEEEEEAAVGQA